MDDYQRKITSQILIVCLVTSLLAGFIGALIGLNYFQKTAPQFLGNSNAEIISGELGVGSASQEERVVQVVKNASPAVVSIIISKNVQISSNPFGDFWPFGFFGFDDNSGDSTQKQEVGGGSGFIVSGDGMILTNKHVVSDEKAEYTVLTNDGQKYPAKVLALDPVQDIAVIKIEKTGLPILPLGNSDGLNVGQTVIAIGNALGEFRNTVSVGVVSGLGRTISASGSYGESPEQLENVIQTDAAINSGNSGGPLLNLNGQVVGINVAMAQGAQNIAFALPVNKAVKDIEQVKKNGKITYAYMGVRYVLITPEIKAEQNLAVDYGAMLLRGQGVNEPAVAPGSPAAKAGLKEKDIILELDGKKISSDNSLSEMIQKHGVGDKITLKVLSDGKEKEVQLALGER